jgi:superfamily II DNA or RNA helicase
MANLLRNYQRKLIDDVTAALADGETRVLVQAPTGSGKTHVIVAATKAAVDAELRVLILATRTRIIRQLHERLDAFDIRHGVIAALLPVLRWNAAAVQVASADTLYRRAVVDGRMPLPPADLVIFDEAHLALGGSRVAILDRYPDAIHLGFTATPAKRSGRPLCDRFDTLVNGPSVRELIAAEHLVRPRVYSTPAIAQAELNNISRDSDGDYSAGELGAVMARAKLVGDVLTNWMRIANGKRTLLFACNKAHGAALVEEFSRAGIPTELLTDQTDDEEREAAVTRLESGETLVLVNCFLLSYGVDVPSVEAIVLARPTRSLTLYLQAVGRGMRPAPGKRNVLVIDHGRVVESLGLPDSDFAWSLESGSNVNRSARDAESRRRSNANERPRTCPECSHVWLVSDEGQACSACGWAPTPKARAVATLEAELTEVGCVEAPGDSLFQSEFYQQTLSEYCRVWPHRWRQNQKKGRYWAWFKTREAFGLRDKWPPRNYLSLPPLPCSVGVKGKLQSLHIAYQKSKARA